MKQLSWVCWTATVRDGRSFGVCCCVRRWWEHRRLLLCALTKGASPFATMCVDGESFAVVCALPESEIGFSDSIIQIIFLILVIDL
ncbi:uncharacterized protein G2W53_007618 [Senna tora]|uniref:Uncharacterized protein n=1 Tax=Senna tora TaxID=362788 RepID=A0A834X6H4_9FABA|nr:uncharacterized protein G2W53_007618 [Senna tora]